MKNRRSVLICLILSASSIAQIKIKGHQIGESTADFLKAEPAIQGRLLECHSKPPHALSVDEVKSRKFPDATTRRDYLETARQGRLFDQNVDAYNEKCNPLFNIFDNNSKGLMDTEFLPTPDAAVTMRATWEFEGGKIIGLTARIFGEYDQVRDDLTSKAGVNPVEISIPYHNGFGATWSNPHADWTTVNLHISLSQDNNPVGGDVRPYLTIEPRSRYDALLKANRALDHPLD